MLWFLFFFPSFVFTSELRRRLRRGYMERSDPSCLEFLVHTLTDVYQFAGCNKRVECVCVWFYYLAKGCVLIATHIYLLPNSRGIDPSHKKLPCSLNKHSLSTLTELAAWPCPHIHTHLDTHKGHQQTLCRGDFTLWSWLVKMSNRSSYLCNCFYSNNFHDGKGL